MPDNTVESLLIGWHCNGRYALNLVADLPAEKMTHQPHAGMNHPAWILCHLAFYHPPILALCHGETFDDPAGHPDGPRYDEGSTPVADPAPYPAKDDLIERFRRNHERIADALASAPADRLAQPPGLARWAKSFGSTGKALTYLMVWHEAVHLGQLSAWRRVQHLPPVET